MPTFVGFSFIEVRHLHASEPGRAMTEREKFFTLNGEASDE